MRILLAVAASWLLLSLTFTSPVSAASCTVGEAPCPDLQAALDQAAAQPDADVVRLRADEPARAGGFSYAGGGPLELIGAGARVPGPLQLDAADVAVRDLTLVMPSGADAGRPALEARGLATQVRVTGEAQPGGVAVRAIVGLTVHGLVVDATGLGAALDAPAGADLRATHATLAGSGTVGARASGAVRLVSSLITGGYGSPATGNVSADHSELAPAPSALTPDLRPAPGSSLIERGDPAPLGIDADGGIDTSEPQEDLAGEVRVADGDGDGTARRDIGAYELRGPPLPVPAGNVLVNPDGEAGGDGAAPPGWTVTGGFTSQRYGEMPFPTLESGAALGGGARFLAGGAGGDATATQVVDLAGSAAQIDAGDGRAAFSGLLGGFRADGDLASAQAVFRGPSGVALGTLELGGVDAAARGNATHLLARTASGAIPSLSRSVEVTLRAAKASGGSYTDAYFDNLGLVLSIPGAPGGGGPGPDGMARLRPFSGVAVLDGNVVLSRKTGRAKFLIGCASATVARCTGNLALAATLVRRQPRVTIGRATVSLAPGGARRVSVRFSNRARSYLRRHTRLRVLIATTAVDGQGVRRARTVPLSVRRQRGR